MWVVDFPQNFILHIIDLEIVGSYNPVWLYNRSSHIVLTIVSMSIFGH